MTYSKDDVDVHSDRFTDPVPAVNVKVNLWGKNEAAGKAVEQDEQAPGFAAWYMDWLEANESVYWPFESSCEQGWERLQEDADTIWNEDGSNWQYRYKVTVESQGRSGGWAVVRGLPDLEDWDAIMLAKWRKFERYAGQVVEGIPYDMASIVYLNVFLASEEGKLTGPSRDVALVGAGL